MKAADLFQRDLATFGAYVGHLPPAKTGPECAARRILREYAEADDLQLRQLESLHVYNVHELLEKAYIGGREEAIDATPSPRGGRPSAGYVVPLLTVGQAREALDALEFRLGAPGPVTFGWDPRGRAAAKRAAKRLAGLLK